MRIEHESTVPTGAESAYRLIADASRRPQWLTELREVDVPPGPVHEGQVFSGRSRAFAHEVAGLSHILEAEDGSSLTEHVVVGVGLRSTWTVSNADGQTTVHHRLDIDAPGGLLAPFERLVLRWWLGRMQRRSLAALGRLAE